MRVSRIQRYIRPSSLADALTVLKDGDGRIIPMSGGVSVRLAGARNLEGVVDLTCLPLDYIKVVDGEVAVGATTPISDVERSPEIRGLARGMFSQAARCVATWPLRNLITTGGDLVQCYYWSCLPPALLALEGRVQITSPAGERWVGASEFFARHPRSALKPGELLTEIRLPLTPEPDAAAFTTFKRVDSEYAIVNLAVWLRVEEGVASDVRIVLGALNILPVRLSIVEQTLTGRPMTQSAIKEAVEAAASAIDPIPDIRLSADYRRRLALVLLRRTLEQLMSS